jgi:hypothetical protein
MATVSIENLSEQILDLVDQTESSLEDWTVEDLYETLSGCPEDPFEGSYQDMALAYAKCLEE